MNRILIAFWLFLFLAITNTSHAAQVNVAGTGTGNAASADNTYVFATGSYTYTIAGFGVGDMLYFPAGGAVGVVNNTTDGNIDVVWTFEQIAITVRLTGISSAQEAQVFGVNSFRAVFGLSSIIILNVGAAGDCDSSGYVNINEVRSAIDMFMGIKPLTPCVDVNGYNSLNCTDLQKVIRNYQGP